MSTTDVDLDATTQGEEPPPSSHLPAELSLRELARWAWRRLTAMNTALFLLFLLAITAAPGSFIPQRSVDPQRVSNWQGIHPRLTPWFERLELFDVYSSPWFSAVYILLLVSLVGCVVPRLGVYARNLGRSPALPPAGLEQLDSLRTADAWPRSNSSVSGEVVRLLRRRGYRIERTGHDLVADRGRLREAGNLLFHASVLIVLAGFAYGKLYGFTGAAVVVQGQSFSNTPSQYDNFVGGARFDAADLRPFGFSLDRFVVGYLPSGQPTTFQADVSYGDARSPSSSLSRRVEVNKPLSVDDTDVYLVGHGYAPVVTVRDGEGNVTYQGPVVFLPEDSTLRSFGVIKVPDARPDQIALDGEFFPTAATTAAGKTYSAFPDLLQPQLVLDTYRGNLGLDDAAPQNVYSLDKTRLSKTGRLTLTPGQTGALPNGAGSITFDAIRPWARFQVSTSPGDRLVLAGVVTGLLGLIASLFVRRRRFFVVSDHDGTTIRVAAMSGRKRLEDDPAASAWLVRRLKLRTHDTQEERSQ